MAACRITPRSRKTGMAASARAISCGASSSRSCGAAFLRGWSAGKTLRSIPAGSRQTRPGRKGSRARSGSRRKPQAMQSMSIWPCSTPQHSAPRPRASLRSSSRLAGDPAARWTGAHGGQAFFAYATNYLIDTDHAIIVDVEATTAIRQAEVLAAKRMIERTMESFALSPARLLGDSADGAAEMLGWLVYEHGIKPHVTVFDKSGRKDGTFSREDFNYDPAGDVYFCPGGKTLTTTGTRVNDGATLLYRASKANCDACALKPRCCPKEAARKVPRSIHEGARDMARAIAKSWEGHVSRRLRKKVEMLFAHLKRILKLDRLRLRGPKGAPRQFPPRANPRESPQAGEAGTDTKPQASLRIG